MFGREHRRDAQLRVPRASPSAAALLDRSERGKLALTGADAKSLPPGPGQQRHRVALPPGTGCYAAFLTPKGKMLGDLRILDTGEELLLDTERVALQGLFNMIRRFSIGYAVELHKRTLERGLISLIGPGVGRRRGRRRRCRTPSTPTGRSRSAGSRPARSGPTSASTCCATPPTPRRCSPRSTRRRRRPSRPKPSSACGSSEAAPATASTSMTA